MWTDYMIQKLTILTSIERPLAFENHNLDPFGLDYRGGFPSEHHNYTTQLQIKWYMAVWLKS